MLRYIRSWLGVKTGVPVGANNHSPVRPAGAPSFEPLEPRLLLNANLPDIQPLLTYGVPSPEQAVYVDLDQRDGSAQMDLSPIVTINVAPCDETNQPASTPVSAESAAPQVGSGVVAENASPDSCGRTEDDTAGPLVPGQQDIAPSRDTSSVGIRGPPDLPGLRLVDPDISNWRGQIIYLDFDGEQNVTYNGPVTVGPFDVPAFHAPSDLAGQEQTVIADVLARLEETFGGSGIVFTTQQPPQGTEYSTIYIGGDDSVFVEYGSFAGLAQHTDPGNRDRGDGGLVFSDNLPGTNAAAFAGNLSVVVAHEAGHLLGYAHDQSVAEGHGADLARVAASGYIVSVGPSSFLPGQTRVVTAKVQNTGAAGKFLILHPSQPAGWTVTALKDRNILGDCNPTIAAGGSYDATFDVTPPLSASSGTITWEFREDGYLSNPLLDTEYQSVSAADTTAPSNPSSFTSSPSANTWSTDNTVDVSWSGASDNVALKRYYCIWNASSTYSVTTSDLYTVTSSGAGSKTSPALADGSTWYFHIRYQDTSDNLASSTGHYGPFKIDRTNPGKPVHQSPSNGGTVSTLRPTLTWSAASDGSGSGIAKYHLKVFENWGIWWDKVDKDIGNVTSYTLTESEALQWGQNYGWRVYAIDNAGNSGEYTGNWYFTVQDNVKPHSPNSYSVTPPTSTWSNSGTISMTWSGAYDNESGLDGYSVVWTQSPTTMPDTTKDQSGNSSSTSYADGQVWSNIYCHVRAVDKAGNWADDALHAGPFNLDREDPGKPTQQSPGNGGTVTTVRPTLTWSAPGDGSGSGVGKYHLKVFENWGIWWDKVDKDIGNVTSYTLTESEALQWGQNYGWRVYAIDNAGNSGEYTSEWNFTTALTDYMLYDDFGGTWHDANKSVLDLDDDNMCWAAAAANVLAWTGWGLVDGMTTSDQMFAYFQDHWTDLGGASEFGWEWWFNGTDPSQGWADWSQVNVPGGGFWPDEDFDSYCVAKNVTSDAIAVIGQAIRNGDGVTTGISADGWLGGDHAITVWGYSYGSSQTDYQGLWVTDSDDLGSLKYYDVVLNDNRWTLQGYTIFDLASWYIRDVSSLSPNTETVDTTPPSPNPSTWVKAPYATGPTSIRMTATTANDDLHGVEYYFDCTAGGGHDSGWQSSASYEDKDLSPNTSYTYRVKTRDTSPNVNESSLSEAASVSTTGIQFMAAAPLQFVKSQQWLPLVLIYRDYPDGYLPNLNYATVKIGPAGNQKTVDLYSIAGANLNIGGVSGHSIEFSDGASDYYEICNDADWWYTLGYIRQSDYMDPQYWTNEDASHGTATLPVEVVYAWKMYDLSITDTLTSATTEVELVAGLPSWTGSGYGWYAGDTHFHSDLTSSMDWDAFEHFGQWVGEYGTPLAIADVLLRSSGLDWTIVTDHSYELDGSNDDPNGPEPDYYRDLDNALDYQHASTPYSWEQLKDNPPSFDVMFLMGEELSVRSPHDSEQLLPFTAQQHVLAFGFGENASVIAAPGFGLGMRDMSEVMWDVRNSDGVDDLSVFTYGAHPSLSDPWHAEPWQSGDVEVARSFTNSNDGSPLFRGFEFWNGSDDSGRESSLLLWETILDLLMNQGQGTDTVFSWYLAGGSDSHLSKGFTGGDVRTVVCAPNPSQNSVLESLYEGRSIITDGPWFGMGVDMNGDGDFMDFGTDVMLGESRVITDPAKGKLLFDWPDQATTAWGNPSVIKLYHYNDEGDPNDLDHNGNPDDPILIYGKTWDAYADWQAHQSDYGDEVAPLVVGIRPAVG